MSGLGGLNKAPDGVVISRYDAALTTRPPASIWFQWARSSAVEQSAPALKGWLMSMKAALRQPLPSFA